MKDYEAIFILKPDTDENLAKAISIINSVITKHNGKVIKEENWGKKPIAYAIKKEKEGFYYKVNFASEPAYIKDIESAYKLNTAVLRVMIIKRESQQ